VISVPDFLSLTLDPIRLALLGAAAVGPVDSAAVAKDLGMEERKVLREYGKLAGAGLIGDDHRLDVEVLRELARSVPTDAPIDPSIVDGPWTDDEALVLARFFSGRRLTRVPSNRSKRRLVLELLALEFEPGRRYPEREVDFALQMFFADYAMLRRYLVDEGFMTRADGVYWRTGGRIPGSGELA
jgi:hypothetical protein